MKIDDVYIFLSVDLQSLEEDQIRYYLQLAKSQFKACKLEELHLFKDGRGKIKMKCFVETRGIYSISN